MHGSLADGFTRPIHCWNAVRLKASADTVWKIIGDLSDTTIVEGLLDSIHVTGQGVGAVRAVELPGGAGTIRERIEEYSSTDRYYVYRGIDSGPLDFTNYLAVARVTPAGSDSSILSWNTVAQAVGGSEDQVRCMLQGNIDHICSVLSAKFGA